MPNSEFTSWMNRCVPTAPVESDGAKSGSESPCHEETVAGASGSGATGWESNEAGRDRLGKHRGRRRALQCALAPLVGGLVRNQVTLVERTAGRTSELSGRFRIGRGRNDPRRAARVAGGSSRERGAEHGNDAQSSAEGVMTTETQSDSRSLRADPMPTALDRQIPPIPRRILAAS